MMNIPVEDENLSCGMSLYNRSCSNDNIGIDTKTKWFRAFAMMSWRSNDSISVIDRSTIIIAVLTDRVRVRVITLMMGRNRDTITRFHIYTNLRSTFHHIQTQVY